MNHHATYPPAATARMAWILATLALCPAALSSLTARGTEGAQEPPRQEPGPGLQDPSPGAAPAPRPATPPQLATLKLPSQAKVMVIPVNDEESTRYGMIDPWQVGFVRRRLARAKEENCNLVILEINTNGGLVASCEEINREIAASGIPSIAFVRGKAFSGGAIISLGCDRIVMEPAATIGGAQAVGLLGDLQQDQREKARSMLVAMVKGLCEKQGYPEQLARGMVDSEIEIYETADPQHRFLTSEELADWKQNAIPRGPPPQILRTVKPKDQILTLTAGEATSGGLAAAIQADRTSLYRSLSIAAPVEEVATVTAAERVARFLGHPGWSVLLVLVALVALVWELKSPGTGIGFGVFGISLGLMLWLAILADKAGWAELILMGLGAILIAIEIFLLPGFGFAGIAGIGCILLSIILAFIPEGTLSSLWNGSGNPWETESALYGLLWASCSLLVIALSALGLLLGGVKLPGFTRLALQSEVGVGLSSTPRDPHQAAAARPGPAGRRFGSLATTIQPHRAPTPALGQGPAPTAEPAPPQDSLVGRRGTTETVLRPTGKVRIEGRSYHATAGNRWIEQGQPIEVVSVQPNGLAVKEAPETQENVTG